MMYDLAQNKRTVNFFIKMHLEQASTAPKTQKVTEKRQKKSRSHIAQSIKTAETAEILRKARSTNYYGKCTGNYWASMGSNLI